MRYTFGGRYMMPHVAVFIGENIPREADGIITNPLLIDPDQAIEILSLDQS